MKVIQQGEVRFKYIGETLPEGNYTPIKKESSKGFILSHSENGNHHILTGGEVLEKPTTLNGLKKFMAVITGTEQLIQDTGNNPHKTHEIGAGVWEVTISREFNPYLQEARRVAD